MRRAYLGMMALALSAALAACAGHADWSKDGVTPEQASADYAGCRSEVQHDLQRDVNIDTDIAASMQQNWQHSQSTETHLSGDASSNAQRGDELLRGCMESKGYAPGGAEPTESPHWWDILSF